MNKELQVSYSALKQGAGLSQAQRLGAVPDNTVLDVLFFLF